MKYTLLAASIAALTTGCMTTQYDACRVPSYQQPMYQEAPQPREMPTARLARETNDRATSGYSSTPQIERDSRSYIVVPVGDTYIVRPR